MTTPAEPDEVWAVLGDATRWAEFDLFVRRVDGTRGPVREGQHLMAVARGLPMRVPVNVRLVAPGRRLGLTVYTAPGLREQIDVGVSPRSRGGSEVRLTSVLEGPFARLAAPSVWVAGAVTTWLLGACATREHRRARGTARSRPGAA